MSELPEGWILTLLSDVAQWGSGGTPSRSNPAYYGGNIPWIKTGELGQGIITDTEEKITELGLQNSSAKIFPKGSVAVAMYGATIGKTAILGIDAATNQACAVGIPTEGVTTTDYLFHYLASQKDAFVEVGKGGAQPNISQTVIKNWSIPLAPLNEQKQIADKLDRLLSRVDACRERCDRIPLILKRFRQSVLAAATSGELTEDRADTREEWSTHPLGELLSDIRYGTAKKSSYEGAGDTPVIRIPNIQSGRVDTHDLKYGQFDVREIETLALREGDVLIIRSNGSIDLVGKAAVVQPEIQGYLFAGYLIRLRPKTELINPYYLYFFLSSPSTRQYIELTARSTSGVNNINSEEVRSIEINLPSLDEQREIVRRVEKLFAFIDRLEARYQIARAQVNRLTPASLDKAFRGELVPQDPNDEPAAVLLEQIRSELAVAKANKPDQRQRVTEASKPPIFQFVMLTRKEIQPSHLSSILKTRGSLTAESLWAESQLEIDDFYDQLKDEEMQGLLRESRVEEPNALRLLEAA